MLPTGVKDKRDLEMVQSDNKITLCPAPRFASETSDLKSQKHLGRCSRDEVSGTPTFTLAW